MTGNDLFREIGNISEKYVTEAEETKQAVILTPVFRRTLATVACLVVCFGLYFGVRQLDLGVQNESASMQSNDNMSSIQTESVVMDSANNSVTASGEESDYEMESDGMFWEEIWPMESETTADATTESYTPPATEGAAQGNSKQEEVVEESVLDSAGMLNNKNVEKEELTQGEASQVVGSDSATTVLPNARSSEFVRERFDGYVQDLENLSIAMAVMDGEMWLQSGLEEVNAFLAKTEKGEEAILELAELEETGASVFYYLHYNGADFYLLKDYREVDGGSVGIEEATYAYLRVFEDSLADGTAYSVIGLGANEDVSLRDIQIGTKDTIAILRCKK